MRDYGNTFFRTQKSGMMYLKYLKYVLNYNFKIVLNDMSIKNWLQSERPREKLIADGSASLSDAELLTLFIHTGCKSKSAFVLAQELLHEFGSIKAILDQPNSEAMLGVGSAKFALMQASLELAERYLCANAAAAPVIRTSIALKKFLRLHFRQLGKEAFVCLFLNAKNQLVKCERLFDGTINYTHIYPRLLVSRCLHHNATSIIFSHNHPSGNCNPSKIDIDFTQDFKKNLAFLQIALVDHLIVTERATYSFAEHGLI